MNTKNSKPAFQELRYTLSDKTIVKKDWAALLKDMDWIRGIGSRSILFQRMAGPLLVRVILMFKTRTGVYEPWYSVVNLAYHCHERNDNCSDSSLFTRAHIGISPQEHRNKYIDGYESLKNFLAPIEGPVSLEDIFKRYNNWATVDGKLQLGVVPFNYAGTPALVAAWAGELDKAEHYLDWGCKVFKEDNKPLGTKAEFHQFHKELISDPVALRLLVEDNISRGDNLNYTPEDFRQAPYQDIAGAAYKRPKPGE